MIMYQDPVVDTPGNQDIRQRTWIWHPSAKPWVLLWIQTDEL